MAQIRNVLVVGATLGADFAFVVFVGVAFSLAMEKT